MSSDVEGRDLDLAVHRIPLRCNSCTKYILLRIVIAGGEQPFLFSCPHCSLTQHGYFYAQPGESYQFRSEDVELLVSEPDEDGLAVMIATDMPVAAPFQGTPAAEIFRSPFIYNAGLLGSDAVGDLMGRIETLRQLHQSWYSPFRKIARLYARRDRAGMLLAFSGTPGGDQVDWSGRDPHELFDRLAESFYAPFEDRDSRRAADLELFSCVAKAREVDEDALRRSIRTLREGPVIEHQARVLDSVVSVFGDMDAIYPALWVEALRDRTDLSVFRVMRDDFQSRKSLYQDIFELSSRTLALIAPIANIAERSDVREYCDGERRNTSRALKERAYKREVWLDDFPEARKLYAPVARTTRNDFGHALASTAAALVVDHVG